jgi:uncharacterized integral membrane protein
MKIIRILILLPLAAAIIVLSVGNRHEVTFKVMSGQYEIDLPLYLLLLATFLMGLLMGGLAMSLARVKRWRRGRAQEKSTPSSGAPLVASGMLSLSEKRPIMLKFNRKNKSKEDI